MQKKLLVKMYCLCSLLLFLLLVACTPLAEIPGAREQEVNTQSASTADTAEIGIAPAGSVDDGDNVQYRDYQKQLNKALKKWRSLRVSYYEYQYMRYCFCINAAIPFNVQVKDGRIISVINKNDGSVVPEKQWEYIYTIEELFEIVHQAIAQKRKIMDLQFDKMYGYPSVVSIDYLPMAIDDEITYLAEAFRALPPVVLTDKPGAELQKDFFFLRSASVTGDVLSLTLLYSGGCWKHDYIMYANTGFMESYPVQVNLYLHHDSHNDPCKAIITDYPAFDLRPLAELYQASYGRKDPIILNIHDFFRKKPRKVIQVVYYP